MIQEQCCKNSFFRQYCLPVNKPKILIFASGTADGGGSGAEKLVWSSRSGVLDAEITIASNHANGGVRKRADKLDIPFIHFPKPWDAEGYQRLARETGADFFPLSGWLKLVTGLDPKTSFNSKTVFNIHPGPLPEFGGPGMYGHHVHEAVMEAFKRGEVKHSAVSMHFVTEGYDRGPVFFKMNVKINDDDTPDSLGQRVNQAEHQWQSTITNMVVNGLIRWDGINPDSLEVPSDYSIENFE